MAKKSLPKTLFARHRELSDKSGSWISAGKAINELFDTDEDGVSAEVCEYRLVSKKRMRMQKIVSSVK